MDCIIIDDHARSSNRLTAKPKSRSIQGKQSQNHRFVCDTRTSLHRTLALVSFPTSSTRTNGSYFKSALSKSLYRIDLGDPLLSLLGSMSQYGQNTDLYTQK
ncbi:hypothetical protein T02_11864 [Trichinella nativa]|uniref:Uncharacterized protein n=1 Tax=Trichinella nativa TaxID=6335 RepID=A0A0V1KW09_9BILA|nr:hypothetical protein T02_11864 [Trichinella nativa]